MHYQYRDIGFQSKTVRFIKAIGINSDGLAIAPVDDLYKIVTSIEQAEPDTIVVMMTGRGGVGVNRKSNEWAHFMTKFWLSYKRQPDDHYEWDSAEG